MNPSEKRHRYVANIDEVEPASRENGRFSFHARRVSAAAGATALGCSWYELPPGKTSFPYHFHTGVEEGLFILRGTGELRIGDDLVAVRAGDYIAFPPGPEAAHQLKNSGTEPLQYLAFSDRARVDVVGYPDSKKLLALAVADPTQWPPANPWVRTLIKEQPSVDYFDGEKLED